MMNKDRMLLAGCGILEKEVGLLIEKNRWPLDALFLDSSLHVDFGKLARALKAVLANHHDRNIIVLYGCCHPLMEQMLGEAGAFRTEGQNCLEMLLGRSLFSEELSKGAFFLLEDWALRWERVVSRNSDMKPEIMREIFRGDREYVLCLRTPCSGDFVDRAEEFGRAMDAPIRWMDVGLDHLEAVLRDAVMKGMKNPR